MPVHDGAAHLEGALDAFTAQDFEDLEILVCDNGSTDATPDIARAAAARDPRVRYHPSDRNRGAAWNFNRAVDLARGRYFKWAAHDDLVGPTLVGRSVAVLDDDPSVALVYPRTAVIDDAGVVVGTFEDGLALGEARPSARLGRLLADATEYHPVWGLMRPELVRRTGMGAYPAADVVFLAEQAMAGRFVELPERLFLRRFHERTSIRANPTLEGQSAWFDPSRRPTSMKTCRVAGELLRAVARTDLAAPERAACTATVARCWVRPRWRDIGGEVRAAARARRPARRPAS
jgi:glycosyltransferase involved in cell wall biosynthesis